MCDDSHDDEDAVDTNRPSNQDIIRSLEAAPESDVGRDYFDRQFHKASVDGERAYEHLRGLKDHYFHKQLWSYFLAFLMLVMVVFQCVLLALVGAKVWDFSAYAWLLPALLAQNFAQIVGLAVFVVKALFKDLHTD